jgi:hypothetical protein
MTRLNQLHFVSRVISSQNLVFGGISPIRLQRRYPEDKKCYVFQYISLFSSRKIHPPCDRAIHRRTTVGTPVFSPDWRPHRTHNL